MPLYRYYCPSCDKDVRRMLKIGEQRNEQTCPTCSTVLDRTPGAPSAQVMETLDNGIMSKKVERLKDAERLVKERSASDPRLRPLD